MAERFPRTISQQLWDAWQILRRKGDAEELMKRTELSRPVIDRALNYGHIKNSSLEAKITKYFDARLEREKSKGDKLIHSATAQ